MKKILGILKTLRILIFGWAPVVALTCLFPLKKNKVLFIGKSRGLFFDNAKYLYLYLHRLKPNDIEYHFLTEKKSVYNTLKQHNLPVLLHPSLSSIYALISSKTMILCCVWNKRISFRAKKVQLWHGVPLKRICMLAAESANAHNSFFERISNKIEGKNYNYDMFVSTSEYFTSNVFSKAVKAGKIIESGYPRNDALFGDRPDELDLLEADIGALEKIKEFRDKGFKSVLYAPTWNDPAGNPIKNGSLDLIRISLLAQKYKLLLVFKFHPSVHCDGEFGLFENIIYYDNTKDIQPLLKITDVLVTDYSSVYMDYLLLDRPIIFFPYNYEKYMAANEGLLFDYNSMTPGPKCYSQDQLHKEITDCAVNHKDEYANERARIKKLAFKYEDGRSCERIWDFIIKEFIERPDKGSD